MTGQPSDPVRRLIAATIRDRGLSMKSLSEGLGHNHAYLQQYIRSNKPEELDEADRLKLAELLGLDEHLLRPSRLRAIDHRRVDSTYPNATRFHDQEWRMQIAEMDVRVSAGPGALVDGEVKLGDWELPRNLIRSVTNSPSERLRVITVIGDSAEPLFRPGEKILVDTGDTVPSPPGMFCLWDGLGVVIKRVEHIPFSEPPAVKITSENSKYTPYERVIGEAYIQGRVLGKWHWT